MKPAFYLQKWQQLKQQPDKDALTSLSQRVALSFVDRYFYSDEYDSGYIHLLCSMATYFTEPSLNQIAARALFGIVIERLCDDFEELQTETYNRLMSQVIEFLRELPEGHDLHSELNKFGLHNSDQIYQRIESIRLNPDESLPAQLKPKKILILSRVTIGADVAITSVICQRMTRAFPEAVISIIGNSKLQQVFSAESGINISTLDYSRRGGLLERFLSWTELLSEIRQQISGLETNEYLLLDPDSRLSQLGVLPLVQDESYRFFNSRGKQGYPDKASISELTNLWLDNLLGENEFDYPNIYPQSSCLKEAENLIERINKDGASKIITLNLGVGGNSRKRISDEFESSVIIALLEEGNNRVILDMGFGEDETQRSQTILDNAKNHGYKVQQAGFDAIDQITPDCQLLGMECSVGEIAALIAFSDQFIGYDSACQHIAAAQGIKTYTIFAGSNNVRFIRRWHACGSNTSEIVYVDTLSKDSSIDTDEIIARLMDLRSD